jgi:DNA-binding CsgD family transcriptional regulator
MTLPTNEKIPCELSLVVNGKKLKICGEFSDFQDYVVTPENKNSCEFSFRRHNKIIKMGGILTSLSEVIDPPPVEKPANPFNLTKRELELLKILGEPEIGFDCKKAGDRMVIEQTTLKTHLNNLYQKTHTHRLAECFVVCLKAGYDL